MEIMRRGAADSEVDAAFESLAEQVARLKREVAALRDLLNVDGVATHDLDHAWAEGLSPAQRAMMAVLIRVYPRWVQPWDLEAAIPTQKDSRDHAVNFARVLVSQVRRKKGAHVIENRYGAGYRVSPDFVAELRERAA